MEMKLELVVLPVTDADRTKAFYADQVGFDLDVDHQPNDDFRVVQMTPPQSGASICFGKGMAAPELAPVQGLHLVVADIEAAVADLGSRGLEIDGPFHFGEQGQTPGAHPARGDYGSFASFADPDGNLWLLQEIGGREGMKLELVVVPTADVERSKAFYETVVGFPTSNDHRVQRRLPCRPARPARFGVLDNGWQGDPADGPRHAPRAAPRGGRHRGCPRRVSPAAASRSASRTSTAWTGRVPTGSTPAAPTTRRSPTSRTPTATRG